MAMASLMQSYCVRVMLINHNLEFFEIWEMFWILIFPRSSQHLIWRLRMGLTYIWMRNHFSLLFFCCNVNHIINNVMLYDRDGGLSRDCWSHLLLPASCDGRVFQEFAQFQRESAFGVSIRGPPSYLSGMLPSLREQATNLLQILGKSFNVSSTASTIFQT